MHEPAHPLKAEADGRRDLYVYNGGFLTNRRIRRILELAGWNVRLGLPGPGDWVGVWGNSPTARRGEAIARNRGARVLRIEDAFLRSVHPGRAGDPPLGLTLDRSGVHFDPRTPSDLESLLLTHPLNDPALLGRAHDAIARIRRAHLSKYNAFDPDHPLPDAPYVLVIDQSRDDASVTMSGADTATFLRMLDSARREHPGVPVVIKAHPDVTAGYRAGHFAPADLPESAIYLTDPVSPWALLEGAHDVYTVSSQMGFEAILAGHEPRVFGQPFYAGWSLTRDEAPPPRRARRLTAAQLFAAAMILYPTWYDPYRDRLREVEDVISALEAQARAWREDRAGYVAVGLRRWKRAHMNAFFGRSKLLKFGTDPDKASDVAQRTGRKLMVWGSGEDTRMTDAVRVEDGFLRSRGLGAALMPPLSLALDPEGIYYDPSRPSRLERLITASTDLPKADVTRAEALIRKITQAGLSKYNTGEDTPPPLPPGRHLLVVGQVEDDRSVTLGTSKVRTNLALLETAREMNPDAVILYKPHPDVEAGLRPGAIDPKMLDRLADVVLDELAADTAIALADEVWTMTSLLGFEALLRGKPVTALGAPFYAGWGLTRDLGAVPDRRKARPSLTQLAHAALIGYPRYHDPVTNLPCPPEVIVDRLAESATLPHARRLRSLSRLQHMFRRQERLWRR
ncbi:MAG: capsular polysaccharide biosynthesis protein [Rhodobacteraceae bacterium]|nr:capsular polysaccharide biosynthesis protein [Paracoccaceae bacterium]